MSLEILYGDTSQEQVRQIHMWIQGSLSCSVDATDISISLRVKQLWTLLIDFAQNSVK